MMRECDLDDNDPLSLYLKKAPMVQTSNVLSPATNTTNRSMSLSEDNKTDSISDVMRRRSENINHSEIDTENDKVKEAEVSKQMD